MIPNIVVKVLCQNMDFRQFPFDTQKCDIALKASSNEIKFAQSEDNLLKFDNSISGEFEIFVKYLNETEIEERFEESQFSRIGFTINLERKSTMYILSCLFQQLSRVIVMQQEKKSEITEVKIKLEGKLVCSIIFQQGYF